MKSLTIALMLCLAGCTQIHPVNHINQILEHCKNNEGVHSVRLMSDVAGKTYSVTCNDSAIFENIQFKKDN